MNYHTSFHLKYRSYFSGQSLLCFDVSGIFFLEWDDSDMSSDDAGMKKDSYSINDKNRPILANTRLHKQLSTVEPAH